MPHPTLYEGTQDDDRTRSVDLVHIEPSIREGLFLVSSIYGPGASAPIMRFPPVFTVQPYITGPSQIPGVLTMNLGQAPASPAAQMQVQWMRNGVDIAGATGLTFATDITMDGWVITGEVRAINPFGEDIAMTSNSVTLSLIEPVITQNFDIAAITGLDLPQVIHTTGDRVSILTGMAADTRLDTIVNDYYLTQGLAAPTRLDVNKKHVGIIEALGARDRTDVFGQAVAVINYEDAQPLVTGRSVPINLKNNDAEAGLAGWTLDGAPAFSDHFSFYEGAIVFVGGTGSYTRLLQEVELFQPWWVDIDAASTFIEWSWYQSSDNQADTANVKLEFLDINRIFISGVDPQGLWAGPPGRWLQVLHEAAIPANTRFIRVIMEFARIDGGNNDGKIDFIQASIRKGAKPNFLDIGANAPNWRIRFTQARTYPGCSLSELEFRNAIGGTDLATGGTVLFGSQGNGGLASFAFDDLRNTGYWAGEQSGVANNTAWIGYGFASSVRPQEVDVTLRPNNFALEFGREMYVEASLDRNTWYPIQLFTAIPDPIPQPFQQQLQFRIRNHGEFMNYKSALLVSPAYVRNTFSVDNAATKGIVFRMKTRMAVDRMRFHRIGSTQAWTANIRMGRAQFQNNAWMYGTVDRFETRNYNNTVWGWEEVIFASPLNLNVNDYFYVSVTDLQAASDPTEANQGRVAYLNNHNSTAMSSGETWMDNEIATRWWHLARNDLNITQGDASSGAYYDYAIDFAGNII